MMREKAQHQLKQDNPLSRPVSRGVMQQKCACGNRAIVNGECEKYAKQKSSLQRNFAIRSSDDPLEKEASRVSDQLSATLVRSVANSSAMRIQRLTGQPSGRMDTVPVSVDQALAEPGSPLESGLRNDMEQRFGYDFSRVRTHSGALAGQSAQEVNADAYTVGFDIVFSPGRYVPGTHEGRKLMAHELTHVVQQSGVEGIRDGQRYGGWGSSPLAVQRSPANYDNQLFQDVGGTLPYREATNLLDCIRIMGPGSAEFCRREVLGEEIIPETSVPSAPTNPVFTGATAGAKSPRIKSMENSRGCAYTVVYSKPRNVDCDTVYKNEHGKNPPEPLCGVSLVYDITSVSAIGRKCPKLDGLKVSEVVKGDQGCTPPGYVWPAPKPCVIGSGGKLSGCTDTLTLCGPTRNLQGNGCTEIVDQEIEVGGQLAEEHEIIFELKKSGKDCTGKVTRN